MYGGRDVCRVLVGKPGGKNHLGDPGVGGRILLIWILGTWVVGGMDWMDLLQDRNRLRELVNGVMNLRVP